MRSNHKELIDRKQKKSQQNQRDYLARKLRQEHFLLRLDKGDLEILGHASTAAGLSRSAFARIYLFPIIATLSERMSDIDRARIARTQSLETFIGRAIDSALKTSEAPSSPQSLEAIDEFDHLFRSMEP